SVYSPVVYQKGAATLAMLENWLGEDAFRGSIRHYLGAHRFGGATTADFVAAVRDVSGRDAGTALASFLDRAGVPLITAVPHRESVPPRVLLRQDRYSPLGAEPERQLWNLPVCVKAEGLSGKCVSLTGPLTELTLESCPSWVYPNAGASGYYRTILAPDQIAALYRNADHLTAAERLSLAGDISALVLNGRLPAAEALAALPAMARDTEPLV